MAFEYREIKIRWEEGAWGLVYGELPDPDGRIAPGPIMNAFGREGWTLKSSQEIRFHYYKTAMAQFDRVETFANDRILIFERQI